MILTEVKLLLKARTSQIVFLFLLFSSMMVMADVIRDESQIQTYDMFMESIKQTVYIEENQLESSLQEYNAVKNMGLEADTKAKKMKVDLMQQQYEEGMNTYNQILSLKRNDTETINQIWSKYLVRRQLRMSLLFGTTEFHDENPLKIFSQEITEYPEIFDSFDVSFFDYDVYTSMDYTYGSHDMFQKHNEYENRISMLRAAIYTYEHEIPVAVYDLRGPELFHLRLFTKDTLFGVGSLLSSFLFFFLHSYHFRSLNMDQYYMALPMKKGKVYQSHMLSSLLTFLILYLVAYALPWVILALRYGVSWMNYPAIIDANLLTSYQGATNQLSDGVYGMTPFVSTNPGPDLTFYPTLEANIQVIPYGMSMMIVLLCTMFQILCISISCTYLVFMIRKRMILTMTMICLLMLLAVTRVSFIPILSYIPLFYPSAIYLLNAGHGIGIIALCLISISWSFLLLYLGSKQSNHQDYAED